MYVYTLHSDRSSSEERVSECRRGQRWNFNCTREQNKLRDIETRGWIESVHCGRDIRDSEKLTQSDERHRRQKPKEQKSRPSKEVMLDAQSSLQEEAQRERESERERERERERGERERKRDRERTRNKKVNINGSRGWVLPKSFQ